MSIAPTIVVPVFNAPDETRRCLSALRRTLAPGQADVIVIDDASTDPAIPALLAEACDPAWHRERQARNLGFVGTVNRGMALAGPADVVLLNSDTVPAGDWLNAMRRCAEVCPDAASITPWTNNGEIVSLPELCRAAPVPADVERWARACLATRPAYPSLPTAVGFCMFLRRACLDAVGDFDARTFGKGYGEENDWCMRATAAGWTHRLCDDAFVAHQGQASFGPLGLKPDESAMQRLLGLHPDYLDRVMAFIRDDPLAPHRARVLAAL
ncbi:glycosyltransferase family 2 protein [Wenzhouxiangella sp. XN79A]|uniref:glycosyltransferase family 2 protein n=1 Tax=Wenzhouxiangella sp. XN79A TaxID=2724193 RepID=UPI00144AE43A|nr:glycosyltransferase family 2 protein [Wenzhouxiangella sp. XN79A]NKI35086.1 glycosyltransferase family 2 protein [Wenzhouxiangella sp. XN79A]